MGTIMEAKSESLTFAIIAKARGMPVAKDFWDIMK